MAEARNAGIIEQRRPGALPSMHGSRPAIVLRRDGGIGDVLMALPLATAMKLARPTHDIVMLVPESLCDIVALSPVVDRVISVNSSDGKKLASGPLLNLNSIQFGIADLHQSDAYLAAAKLSLPDILKRIWLELPEDLCDSVRLRMAPAANTNGEQRKRIVLLHAAAGDENRTWPEEQWIALAKEALNAGCAVMTVGHNDPHSGRFARTLPLPGVLNLVDRLSLLEFIALCRFADVLVSTDSGTVQLAAATEIGIVGIYSVVHGCHRLPYRHGSVQWRSAALEPSCEFAPCYGALRSQRYAKQVIGQLQRGESTAQKILGSWCLNSRKFECLQSNIRMEQVWMAVGTILDAPESYDDHEVKSLVAVNEAIVAFRAGDFSLAEGILSAAGLAAIPEEKEKQAGSGAPALRQFLAECRQRATGRSVTGSGFVRKEFNEMASPMSLMSQGGTPRGRLRTLRTGKEGLADLLGQAERFFKQGEFTQALAVLEPVDEIITDLPEEPVRVEVSVGIENLRGLCLLSLARLVEAKDHFEAALQMNPTSSRACAGLGEVFFRSELVEASKTMFEWAVKNDEKSQAAREGLVRANTALGFKADDNSLFASLPGQESPTGGDGQ